MGQAIAAAMAVERVGDELARIGLVIADDEPIGMRAQRLEHESGHARIPVPQHADMQRAFLARHLGVKLCTEKIDGAVQCARRRWISRSMAS